MFRREAEEATRQSPEWGYSKEAAGLKASLQEIASRSRKLTEAKLQASKQSQQAMQYLQMQQQQLQAIQQQISVSNKMCMRGRLCVWYLCFCQTRVRMAGITTGNKVCICYFNSSHQLHTCTYVHVCTYIYIYQRRRASLVRGMWAWRTASRTRTSTCRAATSRARATCRSPACPTSPCPC